MADFPEREEFGAGKSRLSKEELIDALYESELRSELRWASLNAVPAEVEADVLEALWERQRSPDTDALWSFVDRYFQGEFPAELKVAFDEDRERSEPAEPKAKAQDDCLVCVRYREALERADTALQIIELRLTAADGKGVARGHAASLAAKLMAQDGRKAIRKAVTAEHVRVESPAAPVSEAPTRLSVGGVEGGEGVGCASAKNDTGGKT